MSPPQRARIRIALGIVLAIGLAVDAAVAAPWAEVGDAQMRSDVEVLAAAGDIDDVTMQWPIPWGGLLARLEAPQGFDDGPDYVRAAAERLEAAGRDATTTDRITFGLTSDFTNLPDVVRGFDALGREDVQGQLSAEWIGDTTAIRLQVGEQTTSRNDHQSLLLDGSYIAQRVGNAAVYAGYITHWWGPGWDTALSLSNNARPFPQIGITRLDTSAFESPWLSWMGPWQGEFFVGVLNGPRMARNTLFNGLRWSINPFPGFEFALDRTEQSCGTGHPCSFFGEFLNVYNDPTHVSKSKDETNIELRYTNTFRGLSYSIYTQEMNRDTGPFVRSDTSHLFGMSVWVPVRSTAIRFTAEYASTISTVDFFSFGEYYYGITYTDYKYPDGWQYRGRTLGSSLGTDSRLASFHASWAGPNNWTYTLTYYRASIASPGTLTGYQGLVGTTTPPLSGNLVTTAPVTIDIEEARLAIPLRNLSLQIAARIQDDQPRPDHGFACAGEISLSYHL